MSEPTSDERLAFRAAFIKAAADRGYFKEAFLAPLVLAPLSGLSGTAKRLGESVGSVIGSADAPDDIDRDVVSAQVEEELLRQESARVAAIRQNELLKQVLAKRALRAKK